MTDLNRRSLLTGTVALAASGAVAVSPAAQAHASEAPAGGRTPKDAVTVLPGDPRYEALVVGNNARWVGRPEAVRLVSSTEQVVRAVQEAVDGGKRLSVRGGGHCYADFVFNPAVQLVIDTTPMHAVYFDERRRAFVVEAGATLLQAYEELYKNWGVTIPGGRCYSVGAGGHVTGGGYGFLSRRHGLTIDHLYAVEVVVVGADGRARSVVATREPDDPHRDLWWAHTGAGGGNFGVVTRFWFRTPGAQGTDPAGLLVRPPREVLVNAAALPWSGLDLANFTALVRNYGRWHERNSDPDSPYATLCSFLTLCHQSNGTVSLLTQIDGTLPNAERLLADYLAELTDGGRITVAPLSRPAGEDRAMPELFTPRRLPWLTATKYLGSNNSALANPTLRGTHKSVYLRQGFTDEQIAALHRHLTRTDHHNPTSTVSLLSYGGRINSVRPEETASVQRDSKFKALFQSLWPDEAADEANISWTREIYHDVFASTGGYPVPGTQTDGCYINYADTDITDPALNRSGVPWYSLYYGANYPRLQQVKAAYDPRGVFRHPQSITPARRPAP
ncbi:FAD-binding oxidoreductase [Streptomyces sp. FH025]|uniref:FAD-binding oxidoreductase n=1 Tax=Streptomyces sp. FH025 TaxID=2815937 RepID=UPI001A9DA179|nr:FAD-binding oxidoreductase [Streptomyces sp. FH025]MBO1414340.1 FAD-binding oxidoreductase [Streptomyces sp. FH025]